MANTKDKRYDSDMRMLDIIRQMNEAAAQKKSRKLLKEEVGSASKDDAVAITDDPKFGQNVLQNQIDNFRQTVDGSAKFAKPNPEDPKSSPLVYFPKTGNLVFSGTIPTMSDLKFQYSLLDVSGAPYIFCDGLALTEDVLQKLQKIRGHYLNWRDSFFAASDMLEALGKPE